MSKVKRVCDCRALTERYDCPKTFGKAHCPKHCRLCFPITEPKRKRRGTT